MRINSNSSFTDQASPHKPAPVSRIVKQLARRIHLEAARQETPKNLRRREISSFKKNS